MSDQLLELLRRARRLCEGSRREVRELLDEAIALADRDAEPYDDPAYQRWIEETARGCHGCSEHEEVPCGGCQQGAPCDYAHPSHRCDGCDRASRDDDDEREWDDDD